MKKMLVDFSCSVVAVGKNDVTIDRPVRVDIRPQWKPVFESDAPTVQDVGVENLTIAFPVTPYAGHHNEPGYNGILFQRVSNGWVRNVNILNADVGIVFRSGSKFCTVKGVDMRSEKGRLRAGWEGHHGVEVADNSQDNLITEFRMFSRFIHSISLTSMAAGNVFMKGWGTDLSFDHHRKAPYENLFTEINIGEGSDLWLSGGDEDAGPPSGARETLWNVMAETPQSFPTFAIQMNLIGVTTELHDDPKMEGNWIEAIDPSALTPPNLFESQLALRAPKKEKTKK